MSDRRCANVVQTRENIFCQDFIISKQDFLINKDHGNLIRCWKNGTNAVFCWSNMNTHMTRGISSKWRQIRETWIKCRDVKYLTFSRLFWAEKGHILQTLIKKLSNNFQEGYPTVFSFKYHILSKKNTRSYSPKNDHGPPGISPDYKMQNIQNLEVREPILETPRIGWSSRKLRAKLLKSTYLG